MSESNPIGARRHASRSASDRGFTLIEMLIVVIVLGILASVAVLAVRGSVDTAETAACAAERKNLSTMVEAHFVQTTDRTIVATGVTDDRYEITLVDAQIMRSVSTNYDIDVNGDLTPVAGQSCA